MSQQKWYRGSRHFVVCQAGDGAGHLCRRRTRFRYIAKLEGKSARVYDCELGHRFGLAAAPFEAIGDVAGELDDGFTYDDAIADARASSTSPLVSGESVSGQTGGSRSLVSGEIDSSLRDALMDPWYTDRRRVTLIPVGRAEFGRAL